MNKKLKIIYDDVSAIKAGLTSGTTEEASDNLLFFLMGITTGRLEGLLEKIKLMMEND